MKKIKLSIDLCDTLIKGNTTFIFLDSFLKDDKKYLLYKKIKKNILVRLILKILYKMKLDLNRKIALRFISGQSKNVLISHLDSIFEKKLLFNNDILNVISVAKKNNIDIYIVSASLDFIVEYVSTKLELNFVSSQLSYKDNICSGYLSNDLLFSKQNWFLSKFQDEITLRENLIYISDNIEDIPVLKKIKYGYGFYNKKNTNTFIKNNIKKYDYCSIKDIIENA